MVDIYAGKASLNITEEVWHCLENSIYEERRDCIRRRGKRQDRKKANSGGVSEPLRKMLIVVVLGS